MKTKQKSTGTGFTNMLYSFYIFLRYIRKGIQYNLPGPCLKPSIKLEYKVSEDHFNRSLTHVQIDMFLMVNLSDTG